MGDHHCQDMLGNLSEYIDGELAAELCAHIERHLETCPDCRIVVNTLRKTIDLYHTESEMDDLPGDVRRRLYTRLDLAEYLK